MSDERLPHVRGGVSTFSQDSERRKPSSPRAWGCFSSPLMLRMWSMVFPTCVGVFLSDGTTRGQYRCLPHVRGGVSNFVVSAFCYAMSSPRAWGCFQTKDGKLLFDLVFPTCVGVFPRSAPSARRSSQSSPRAWGCFHVAISVAAPAAVFPTCVGVFPSPVGEYPPARRLPHVRGGVSGSLFIFSGLRTSSPRAWGCFSGIYRCLAAGSVFPTCVGVFPAPPPEAGRAKRLPHVRGGVSQKRD